MNLKSEKVRGQMGTFDKESVGRTLTLRMINTLNFDIWCALATNMNVFTLSQTWMTFHNVMRQEAQNMTLFTKSKKFWHARFGPNMP